jgi:putative Holliday junction resolvase
MQNQIKLQSLIQQYKGNFKLLALDLGVKKLGFAALNWAIKIPLPLRVMRYQGDPLPKVKQLLLEEKAHGLLIGDCSFGRNFKSVLLLKKILEKDLALPVFIVDEALTTFEAQERLKDITLNYKRRNQLDDAIAAQIMLEDFLCRYSYL